MEKLTITRVAPVKEISFTNKKTGKPDSFKKVGIQTNEYGERWLDVAFRGNVPVEVGKSYDFEVKEREYTARDGKLKKAYDAELPRASKQAAGMSSEQYQVLLREVRAVNTNLQALATLLRDNGLVEKTSDGTRVPDFSTPPTEAYEDQGVPVEF